MLDSRPPSRADSVTNIANMKELNSIGVVGAGTMGSGIAQVFAAKGYQVKLCDAVPSQLERALSTIKKNLNRDLEKNRINETDRDRILTNIRSQADLEGLKHRQRS